jgi:hypothetical protein
MNESSNNLIFNFCSVVKCFIAQYDPGRRGTVGNGWKAREIAAKWKQYSGRKLPDFFPMDFGQFPVLSDWKLTGISRKNICQFPTEIVLPLSSTFPGFPSRYNDFSASFRSVPMVSILRNH